jgi:HEAT repeat protein
VRDITPEELEALLRDPSVPFEQRRDRAMTLEGVADSTAIGLNQALEAGDWGKFELFLLVAAAHPDLNYTAPITAALALQSPSVPNEDALEVLVDLGDPENLDLLVRIARTEHDWDEFSQIGVKAVWAIAAIATPAATAALADLAENGNEYVSHWARRKLDRREQARP